jgi:hypothetical protein
MVDEPGTEGPSRRLRPPLAAQRWLIDEARAEELRAPWPWRADGLVVEAADRIQGLEHERQFDGFGTVVLNHEDHSLAVYWKGPLPNEMDDLLQELRRRVAIDVRDAPYSMDELSEEVHRISGLDPPGICITSVGPMRDCSGLRVTVDVGDDLARASREIKSRMKLEFGVQPRARALALGHPRWGHRGAPDARQT